MMLMLLFTRTISFVAEVLQPDWLLLAVWILWDVLSVFVLSREWTICWLFIYSRKMIRCLIHSSVGVSFWLCFKLSPLSLLFLLWKDIMMDWSSFWQVRNHDSQLLCLPRLSSLPSLWIWLTFPVVGFWLWHSAKFIEWWNILILETIYKASVFVKAKLFN